MKTILIADDEIHLRYILKESINQKKYIVYEAKDGQETLDVATEINPDIILLDVAMPKKSGFEVAETLMQNKSTSTIIMLSAKAQQADIEKGLSVGAKYYITKPFDLLDLLNLIDQIAEKI